MLLRTCSAYRNINIYKKWELTLGDVKSAASKMFEQKRAG